MPPKSLSWIRSQFAPLAETEPYHTKPLIKAILWFWALLLPLWLLMAPLSFMIFDNGPRTAAYVFVWAICLYPVGVIVAFVLRYRFPLAVFLPAVLLVVYWIAGLVPPG